MKTKLSVIIPAYNEEKYIEKTLISLSEQDFRNFETIVVCNGCTDNTEEIARKYAKIISVDKPVAAEARNIGARAANGEKYVFLDADTVLESKDVLSKIYESKAVIGTCLGKPNSDVFENKVYFGIKNLFTYLGMVNHITFCDKEKFDMINGYDNSKWPAENRDLIRKMRKHGRFKVIPAYIRTSMRRYERFGFGKQLLYWIRKIIGSKEEYENVR